MSRVRFGDVAREIRKTSREVSGLRVVGLEHLEPENINLEQWAESNDNTFSKLFSKGQVLFGRRRAYLKKAALATFDGVCSGDITVIEAIPGILDADILPFIVQNDAFFDFAVGGSAGSLSPRVKWEHLSQYEFNLPPLEEQKKLAKVLWAMERTKRAYKELLNQSAALAKSLFVEMFGDPLSNEKKWPVEELGGRCRITTGNTPPRADADNYGSCVEWVKSDNLVNGHVLLAAERLSEKGAKLARHAQTGDLLMTCIAGSLNTIGNASILDRHVTFNQQINAISPQKDNPVYLLWLFRMGKPILHEGINKVLKGILNKGNLSKKLFPFPPRELQDQFAAFIAQLDKSQFALKESLSKLTAAQKALMNQAFEK